MQWNLNFSSFWSFYPLTRIQFEHLRVNDSESWELLKALFNFKIVLSVSWIFQLREWSNFWIIMALVSVICICAISKVFSSRKVKKYIFKVNKESIFLTYDSWNWFFYQTKYAGSNVDICNLYVPKVVTMLQAKISLDKFLFHCLR